MSQSFDQAQVDRMVSESAARESSGPGEYAGTAGPYYLKKIVQLLPACSKGRITEPGGERADPVSS